MSIEKLKEKTILWIALLAVLIGTMSFLVIYGTTPLHVSNDNWIMAAIDEDDIVQHYAGWTMYRSEKTTFPLGMIEDMARGTGTTLTYTDSVPLVAIVLKPLLKVLGITKDFQYFGLFTLLCFILQAYAAGLLVKRKTDNLIIIAFSQVLFCFAPPLLDRTLRHTALGAQFLVLFAMLTYFKVRDEGYTKYPYAYIILAVLAVGIHPYFLPMVMIFSLLTMIEGWRTTKKPVAWISQFASSAVAAGVFGIVIGAFTSSGDVEREGFGNYSMNLLAPINPAGGCGYTWSRIIPSIGLTGGNYEGFNYLGLGVIIAFGFFVIKKIIAKNFGFKNNTGYYFIMLFMTMFAVSNVVTFGKHELFIVPLPSVITDLCGIFRSSGRMFYPVFYSIYLWSLYKVLEVSKQRLVPVIILAVVTLLQLFDLSSAVKEKHEKMANVAFYQSILDDPVINKMAEECDYIVGTKKYRDVCVLAGLYGDGTSFTASTGGTWDEANAIRDKYISDVKNGIHDEKTLFVTESWTFANEWVAANDDLEMYQYGENYFVAPKR